MGFRPLYSELPPLVGGLGEVVYDLGYGGAFYALVDVNQLNMDFKNTPVGDLERAATDIKHAIMYANI